MSEIERIKKERGIWDRIAGNYDNQTSVYKNAYELSIEKSKKVLKKDSHVLEVACGTGIISLGIANQVNKVTAIDISSEMISVAKSKAQRLNIANVDFEVADGYSMKYDNNSFDVILLFNALHIVKEPDTLLKEMHRLLKPNGYLVTATDCYKEPVPLSMRIKLSLQGILKLVGFISYLRNYKKDDINKLLQKNKFRIIEEDVLHAVPVNYYVLAQK